MQNNFPQPGSQQNGQPPHQNGLLSGYGNQPSRPPGGPQQPSPPGPRVPFPPQQPPRRGPAQIMRRWSQKLVAFGRQLQTGEMMQRWTNRMAALRRQEPSADHNPLMRYRPPQSPALLRTSPEVVSARPWRISRTQRITRLIRKRRERQIPGSKRVGTVVGSTLIGLVMVVLISGLASSYAYYQNQLPRVQNLANLQGAQSSRIYDRNGKLLYTLYDHKFGRSTPVSYNEIPGFMQDAQIAAEDKTFWTNDGVDLQATFRSAVEDLTTHQVKTGASTLTQQIIKNLTGNGQINLQRKFTEAILAMGLTEQYPKWKILEMYFNISPYGSQEQGIEAAAQDFFGLKPLCDAQFKCTPAVAFLDRDLTKCKNPADEMTCAVNPVLGLARASLMASIPQNPPTYDPLTNPDNYQSLLLPRQDYVLQQMLAAGMNINLGLGSQVQNAEPITPEIVQQAEQISKNFTFTGFQGNNVAPHFVRWVIQTVADALGNGDYGAGLTILGQSGLNIRTTLDSNLETYVENAIYRHIDQPEFQPFIGRTETLSKSDNLHDSAAVVMDAKTGEVLAMDGSVDWNDTSAAGSGQVNMALAPRQPGSSFKPIVLAAAYQMGWYPGIVVPDFKTYFPNGESRNLPAQTSTYTPFDYGHTYHNQATNEAVAIANSYNIPALKTQYFAGLQNVYTMAARLGITSINPKTDLVSSTALGTDAVPLLQMVGAYQTFANQGTHIPPQNVLDIWDNFGHQLYHYDPTHPDGAQVLSPQVAYLVTTTLDNERLRAPEFGNDHVLSMWDWNLPDGTHPDVAAKTGTTDSFKDNWTLGYTPDVVVGVWSGNANDSPMVNSIGVTGAAPIWHSIIEYVTGKCNTTGASADQIPCPPLDLSYTDRHFSNPGGIIQQSVNTVNGLKGSGYTSYMLDGEIPQQSGLPARCDPNQDPNCTTGNGRKHGRHGG